MYKTLSIFVLGFLFCQQLAVAQAAAADTTHPNENALLWEITGKGLKKPSYLYGTIHLIGKEDFFMTESTKKAFKECEKITFEINMKDMMDFSSQLELMSKAIMENGQSLKDLLSKEDYQLVKAHFDKIGMPLFLLERIKPMFLTALTSGDVKPGEDLKSDNSSTMSYEMEFMQMADDQKKEMGGLETAEYQMSMFDSIPYKVQAQMLVDGIKSGNEGDDQLKQMVELYKKQDLEGLRKTMQADDAGIGPYEDMLLVHRNQNWIPVMSKMMKEHNTFFAVGAGHLVGDKGVISLLRKEGYTLRPLHDPIRP